LVAAASLGHCYRHGAICARPPPRDRDGGKLGCGRILDLPLYRPQRLGAGPLCPSGFRGRGLAMYVTVMFGALTIGSAIWGQLAVMAGLPGLTPCRRGGRGGRSFLTRKVEATNWRGCRLSRRPMHWPRPGHDSGDRSGPRTGSGDRGIPH